MYRVISTTPLQSAVKVAGVVSGFSSAMTGYPATRKATTTKRQVPCARLPMEFLPSVRPVQKAVLGKRPVAGYPAAYPASGKLHGYDLWSEPHA